MQLAAHPVRLHRDAPVRRRAVLAAVSAFNAIAALGGAVGLVGGGLDMGRTVTDRLPFHSPVVAGAALAALVAVPSAVLAVMAWRGDRRTGDAAVIVGVQLVGWIAVQLAFIRTFSPFQPAYAVMGIALVLAGRREAA